MDSTFYINTIPFLSIQGNTAMQSSLSSGFDIPRFCYHEKLSIAGNCRMCLLEVAYPRSLKPMASCALPVISGMSVYTNTVMVKKAREGVLELLLINHPLDCPICDQGGECDLQEETQRFGSDRGRFYESKRAVEDKECGPIVKTSMNRCIHCTKCVRFSNEICGETTLGTLGRGSNMEIGTYVETAIESEFSGNLPDICPVGALTSKPYAFKARYWELRHFETLDIIDSIGSRIKVSIRGTEIMRILPSQSETVNEDWITDRTRYCYDGFKTQRLHAPLVKIAGSFVPTSWETAFHIAAYFLNSFSCSYDRYNNQPTVSYLSLFLDKKISIFGLFGDLVDSETLVCLNDFLVSFGSFNISHQQFQIIDQDFRSSYLLNISFDLIEKADLFVSVGVNLRLELPLLNLRVRKSFLYSQSLIISFGFLTSLTYQYFQQGTNINSVLAFLQGKSYVSKCLIDSKFPIIFIGHNCLKNFFSFPFLKHFHLLKKYSNIITLSWHGLNFIESKISLLASNDLGLRISESNVNINILDNLPKFFYLCGVENISSKFNSNFSFKIFQGHSGDSIAFSSDVIFPGCTFIEKEALYVTLEGKVQKTKFILNSPALARMDWKIITGFHIFFNQIYRSSKHLNMLDSTHFYHIAEIRKRLVEYSPSFDIPEILNYYPSHKINEFFSYFFSAFFFRSCFYIHNFLFITNSKNFFFNNTITQISKIMGVCAGRFGNRQSNFLK